MADTDSIITPPASPFLGLRNTSPGTCRLTHEISLEEFEDEDLSEITDECGISLHCKDGVIARSRMTLEANNAATTSGKDRRTIQAEMLQLDLIDATDETEQEEEDNGPWKETKPAGMASYRPKRPTTLNLFPQVPRSQDTLNNNSFGKKYSWQEKVSRSSSPLKTGDGSPVRDHVCLGDESKAPAGGTVDKGTTTSQANVCRRAPAGQGETVAPAAAGCTPRARGGQHEERIRYQAQVEIEATEEIYLTPVQRNSDSSESEKPFLSRSNKNRMSTSSDADTAQGLALPDGPRPSIGEEDEEVYSSWAPSLAWTTLATGERCQRPSASSDSMLSYDSVKYTLVVDEDVQLELVSLKHCYSAYSDDSDDATVYDNCVSSPYESAIGEDYEEGPVKRDSICLSQDSTPEDHIPFSKKFLNVFMSGRSRVSSAESFGLFSCRINGEERDQTHRAVFRFIPRHDDELELEVDDPLLVEVQADDYWYEAYNMRTGDRGIFPAYYALDVPMEPAHFAAVKNDWVDLFPLKFLGSVQVPYHKGNDVLCAAMQKIATSRRLTVQFNPPSSCVLEIGMRGVKIAVQLDGLGAHDKGSKCSHFFQLKNVSFCGYHPKNTKYFGFITKHPSDHRFACHVFVSEDSTKPIAESVGRAFQEFYKEHIEYTCPTEDIYLE